MSKTATIAHTGLQRTQKHHTTRTIIASKHLQTYTRTLILSASGNEQQQKNKNKDKTKILCSDFQKLQVKKAPEWEETVPQKSPKSQRVWLGRMKPAEVDSILLHTFTQVPVFRKPFEVIVLILKLPFNFYDFFGLSLLFQHIFLNFLCKYLIIFCFIVCFVGLVTVDLINIRF